jgi:Fe-S-cluster containining protein
LGADKKLDFTYPANVCFECNRCGLCCGDTQQKTRHILLLGSEAKAIAEALSIAITEFAEPVLGKEPYVYEMKKPQDGKCFFLKNNQCTNYDLRPLICRFYPFELKFAPDQDTHVFNATLECPTVGKGKTLTRKYFQELFALAQEKLG